MVRMFVLPKFTYYILTPREMGFGEVVGHEGGAPVWG